MDKKLLAQGRETKTSFWNLEMAGYKRLQNTKRKWNYRKKLTPMKQNTFLATLFSGNVV